ncbi:MAG: hypothetical protein LBM70_00695 [Victivallales bacterium]|jgi:hypothetical protein|nr:hypothetical protein [Victivallales bacterium]
MKILSTFLATGLACLILGGCAGVSSKRLPSEDLEVPILYPEEIAILKNPKLTANSLEKYNAIKSLIKKVDFSLTREAKTIDDLLYFGDGVPDATGRPDRIITFNYQYGDHYVRLVFYLYYTVVLRTDVIEK